MFDPSEDYHDSRVCLGVEAEIQGVGVTAYTSPDAEGKTYFPDGALAGGPVEEKHGSPFLVDVVLWDTAYPPKDSMRAVREELGERMTRQYDDVVDNLFTELEDADDPEEALLSLKPDDITPSGEE